MTKPETRRLLTILVLIVSIVACSNEQSEEPVSSSDQPNATTTVVAPPPTEAPDEEPSTEAFRGLLSLADLDPEWGLTPNSNTPVESDLSKPDFCSDMALQVADLGDVLTASFDGPEGTRLDQFVVTGNQSDLAQRFETWSADGVHDCVQVAVETMFDQSGLEGTIIEPEDIPEGVDGFGYRVTIVYLDDDGDQSVTIWSSTMLLGEGSLAKIEAVHPDTRPIDVEAVVSTVAGLLG